MSSLRPSTLAFDSGRQSPFRRQNSVSPATVAPTSPVQSHTKAPPTASPRLGSLSPEKSSPFVRRPSQLNHGSPERPSSPFARPNHSSSAPSQELKHVDTGDSSEKSGKAKSPSWETRAAPTFDMSQGTGETSSALRHASPSTLDGAPSPSTMEPVRSPVFLQSNQRSTTARGNSYSSVSPATQPDQALSTPKYTTTSNSRLPASSSYNHIPPTLLRSMRESFEVLDSSNSGSVDAKSVQNLLEQMSLDSSSAGVREFFPQGDSAPLNLARYLDVLSAPLAELSPLNELTAAFSAFDVDDSGQIDVAELKKALLNTTPDPGEDMVGLSERDVDSIIGEFAGKRAFGAKGLNAAKGRGDVFRYRDFMASITGGAADGNGSSGAIVA